MKIVRNFLKILYVLFFPLLALGTWGEFCCSAKIENNVGATANTGGNKIEGLGSIETGDAKAEAKSVNIVNGEGENSIKAQVRAETNGESVEVKYEGSGPAEIKKESENGKASSEIKIKNSQEFEPISENDKEKSFFEKVWDFITSIF